jgi:chromosome segregation ATPase
MTAEVEHLGSKLERAKSDYERTRQERDTLEKQLMSTKDQMAAAGSAIKEKELGLESLDKEIVECSDDIARLDGLFEREQSAYYEATLRLQDLNTQMAHLDEGVTEIRSTIRSDSKELGLTYEELRDAEESLKKTEEELSELGSIVPAKTTALQRLQESEGARRQELEDTERQLVTVDAQVSESSKLVASTKEELIKIQARQDALRNAGEPWPECLNCVTRERLTGSAVQ